MWLLQDNDPEIKDDSKKTFGRSYLGRNAMSAESLFKEDNEALQQNQVHSTTRLSTADRLSSWLSFPGLGGGVAC